MSKFRCFSEGSSPTGSSRKQEVWMRKIGRRRSSENCKKVREFKHGYSLVELFQTKYGIGKDEAMEEIRKTSLESEDLPIFRQELTHIKESSPSFWHTLVHLFA